MIKITEMEYLNLDLILQLASDKYDSFQALWTIYVTIALGIITVLVALADSLKHIIPRILLAIAFIAFALTSIVEMHEICNDRLLLQNSAMKILKIEDVKKCGFLCLECKNDFFEKYKDEPIKAYVLNMTYSYPSNVLGFHVLIDLIVLLLIWFLPKTLVRLKLPLNSWSRLIKIHNSKLPSPIISYNQEKSIWSLEKNVLIKEEQLIEFKDYNSNLNVMEIPKGFEFDLATIPRFIWVFIAPFELSIIAPLVHDYLYLCEGRFKKNDEGKYIADLSGDQLISRKEADDLFFYHMKLENIGKVKRWFAYIGVRFFGIVYWKDN